jgi:quercetin dioxygenase-like cupin family protein
MKAVLVGFAILAAVLCVPAPSAAADARLEIKKLAERKVEALPPGDLFWRVESFASLADAQAAAGPYSLAAESREGKAWLFTLGASGGKPAGKREAEIGPITPVAATEYLLRINEATGAPGTSTPVHSHPGSEAFLVLDGEQSVRGPYGVMKLHAGEPSAGNGANVPMQVSSTGTTEMHALVMFILDAGKPFSSPSKMP